MSNELVEKDIDIIKKALDYCHEKIRELSNKEGLPKIIKDDLCYDLEIISKCKEIEKNPSIYLHQNPKKKKIIELTLAVYHKDLLKHRDEINEIYNGTIALDTTSEEIKRLANSIQKLKTYR
jgi:hypothetical protein